MTMLARNAESLYWIGRYVERADDTARILDVTVHQLLEDSSVDPDQASRTLLRVLGIEPPDEELDVWSLTDIVAFSRDTYGGCSIVEAISAARENARGAREVTSGEIWECLNTTYNALAERERAAKRLVLRRRLRHCRATMPMGRKGVAYFDHYLSGDRPATLVPYEPDYEAFRSPDRQRTAELAQSLQLDPERKRIIFCARLVPVKGVELLIDAFAAVAPAFPDWDVMIAGDGPLRQSLEQRVPADLQARVRFLGHIREPWQVAALYHLSKVMVLPSRFEPWALVVNEAVASGLAVISSDVVGAAFELVRPGVNGYRFTSGDARSLEQALRDTLPTERLAALQAGSAQVLADWRRDADPVQGIRDALGLAGLLPLLCLSCSASPGLPSLTAAAE